LADLLERELPPTDRRNLRQLIGEGAVRVNGEVVLANRRLRLGDVVQVAAVDLPGRAKSARALPEVVFESATALVVAKPAGVPVVPDRSGADRGLHGQFEALRPGADLRVVHRLDRDTSGCLLLAKGLAAAQHFDVQFREGLVHKRYVALVHGVPVAQTFTIDAWLGPDSRRPGKVVASPGQAPGFREARTEAVIRSVLGQQTLLQLHPHTGRSHQLRVHLQSIGHPIVGDADYGGAPLMLSLVKRGYKHRPGVPERPLLARMFLHAEGLSFHDVDGTPVSVEVPLAADLAMALQKLERFDEGRR
jgi:23S rRNA pseudouridine955/2504/2580 synthase